MYRTVSIVRYNILQSLRERQGDYRTNNVRTSEITFLVSLFQCTLKARLRFVIWKMLLKSGKHASDTPFEQRYV